MMEPMPRREAETLCQKHLTTIGTSDPALHDVVRRLIDWARPGESALALMGTAMENADRAWPAEVTNVALALIRYQCHLAYLDGRDDATNDLDHNEGDET